MYNGKIGCLNFLDCDRWDTWMGVPGSWLWPGSVLSVAGVQGGLRKMVEWRPLSPFLCPSHHWLSFLLILSAILPFKSIKRDKISITKKKERPWKCPKPIETFSLTSSWHCLGTFPSAPLSSALLQGYSYYIGGVSKIIKAASGL